MRRIAKLYPSPLIVEVTAMVYLSRIYTKSGDGGETTLGDGARVSKCTSRVAAYGDVDELNAVLGLICGLADNDATLIRSIQNELFDVGADLCVPLAADDSADKVLRISPQQTERLEREIDIRNERLQPLRSFVLPGGTPASGSLHFARTVCRRAERGVVALMQTEPVNPNVVVYLNRLSDLLFVMARVANEDGKKDVLWEPGQSRSR
jgi:cob(I)alamin adenosyltransferase